jgi:hypothetical protein
MPDKNLENIDLSIDFHLVHATRRDHTAGIE